MSQNRTKTNSIHGGQLNVAASIYMEYSDTITALIERMAKDIKKELIKVFEQNVMDAAMDASITSQGRIVLNALLEKWNKEFSKKAKSSTDKMIRKVERNSATTLGLSLKQISEDVSLKMTLSPEIEEVMKASTLEAANLIKTLPQQYLADVQGQVMRSITTGRGLQDLVPYLNTKYRQNIRKARNVARDQTNKAYNNLQKARLQKLGIQKFEWMHSGAGKEPRKLHQELNGKIFSFDDPPYIGDMYGQRIYGIPGEMIFCRCKMRPILEIANEDE